MPESNSKSRKKDPASPPDWTLQKDPSFNNCCHIDFEKRVIRFNPKLYWVRYTGKKKPEVYVYALKEGEKVMEGSEVAAE